MRVCQLAAVGTVAGFLVPLVDGLRAQGHEVIYAAPMERDGREVARHLGEVELLAVPAARRVTLRAVTVDVLAMAAALRRARLDVVHVHGPLVSMQARLAARLAGVPVVISQAHGFYFHEGTSPVARRALMALERAFCRRLTDYLVTVSAEDRDLAIAGGFRPPERIVHVDGVGVDTARFAPDPAARAAVRAELGAAEGDVVVAFVGRLVREKGLGELGAALAALLPARPRLRAWIVGEVLDSERDHDGPAALTAAVDGVDGGDRVRWLGRRADVARVLAGADALALPSYREGMPVSVMEAMAVGLPVVATDVRGCREAVVDGETGLLVAARDAAALTGALARLVDDPWLRVRLGVAGRRRALARYAHEPAVAPLLELYDAIASQRAGERALTPAGSGPARPRGRPAGRRARPRRARRSSAA